MQFKVPQFLEIEDKIFGPFTFRQFVYLAGGAGICFVLYKLLGLFLGAIPIIMVGGFAGALTWFRPNNKPFINMIEAGFKYFTQDKLYIWKKGSEAESGDNRNIKSPAERQSYGAQGGTRMATEDLSKLSTSKLRDLAWSLDVLDLSKKKES
ncbi:MAG: PrgI family protein [Minisyncoccia bacterium]